MTHEPVPQRLSDADRDAAAAMLREHHEAGRLDAAEFSERVGRALAARYTSEMQALFEDLPAPHPNQPGDVAVAPAAAPTWETASPAAAASVPAQTDRSGSWIPVAQGLVWPVVIVLGLISGLWWLAIPAGIIGSIILKQLADQHRQPPPQITP